MLVLFCSPGEMVEIGVSLLGGQRGYVLLINRKGEFCLFDSFFAKEEGFYRSHKFSLDDDSDYVRVVAITSVVSIAIFERASFHRFLWAGTNADAILSHVREEQPHILDNVVEINEMLVVSRNKHFRQPYNIIDYHKKGVDNVD